MEKCALHDQALFEKYQNAQPADLFPPLRVDVPCHTHTQSMAAKNLSPLRILPFIKQGLKLSYRPGADLSTRQKWRP
ncbi:hypothetical protein [Oscillibacter sp. 1-3]|uniref:hypothetical protein n=1 Tax=Oscillibacter sp. 1-3 TaxID=1235797 RepID=UPI0012DF04E7|nr:hypothetical protein [Oscillibacter sp. 1-3]